MSDDTPAGVVAYWREAGARRWFTKDVDFDARLRMRYLDLHESAARRELDRWASDAEGMLALLILLDQFPRNAFRGSAHMFATDPLALHFARVALERGFDAAIEPGLRMFCYLPFEHSEDPADQDQSVRLMAALGREALDYAELHRDIIHRFGRFPHRNRVLGRRTTAEEQAFLDGGGFAG